MIGTRRAAVNAVNTVLAGTLLLCCSAIPAKALDAPAFQDSSADDTTQLERGKYLVHHVAMCVICHSPRTADGSLDRLRLFQGASVPVRGPRVGPEWASRAPRLAGLTAWRERDIVTLLQTGRRPGAERPRPPMPPYRMTEEDAEAVVTYLRSLP